MEVVARGSRGGHRARLPLLVGASSAHRASIGRIGINANDIIVRSIGREVGHQGAVTIHRKGVICISRNLVAVLRPIRE